MKDIAASKKDLWVGAALVILSASCFGVMPLFGRLAYHDGVTPASLLFLRFVMASPVLALLAWWRGASRPPGRAVAYAVLMGGVFVCNSLAYFVALKMVPAATVAILFFSYPVIVAVVSRFLFAERLGSAKLTALGLAIVGCVAVVWPAEMTVAGGAAFALLASLIYAGYVLLARSVSPTVDSFTQASLVTGVAAALLGVVVSHQGLTLPASASGWLGVIALSGVSTVVAISAFLAGVRRLGSTGAATLSAAEPIVAAMVGATFLGEPLKAGGVIGIVMVVAATALVVTDKARGKLAAA